ncbi:MAG: chromate transporter [Clostridia bacterium]|nr:chromate transporter [Clostridia bacterium]
MIWLRLFWEYFKTGLFAVGGGMATVPFLREMSARTGWFTAGKLADMIAVSESTPGPIGVNMATYVGYTVGFGQHGVAGGVLGGLIATLGLVTPSFIVILLVAAFLRRFQENRFVKGGLYGLRPASVGLIAAAGVSIVLFAVLRVGNIYEIGQAALDWRMLLLAAVVLVLTRWVPKVKKWHPVVFILFSAVVGIALDMGA